jgi:hypothetical protein
VLDFAFAVSLCLLIDLNGDFQDLDRVPGFAFVPEFRSATLHERQERRVVRVAERRAARDGLAADHERGKGHGQHQNGLAVIE